MPISMARRAGKNYVWGVPQLMCGVYVKICVGCHHFVWRVITFVWRVTTFVWRVTTLVWRVTTFVCMSNFVWGVTTFVCMSNFDI